MTKRKRIRRKLTDRQREFFRRICKGEGATKAALAAGYSGKNPSQSAFAAMRGMRARVEQALAERGLTPEGLITKFLQPALSATKTEFAKFEGQFTDSREVIAWDTRLAALDMGFKLHGAYAPRELSGPDSAPLFPQLIDVGGMRSKLQDASSS